MHCLYKLNLHCSFNKNKTFDGYFSKSVINVTRWWIPFLKKMMNFHRLFKNRFNLWKNTIVLALINFPLQSLKQIPISTLLSINTASTLHFNFSEGSSTLSSYVTIHGYIYCSFTHYHWSCNIILTLINYCGNLINLFSQVQITTLP
jgi:hypothetical protein